VIDFGLARFVAPASLEASVTSTGVVLGTLRFIAPEQARAGADSVGPRADRWSLALIAS
jgi:serine/threonine protein kinase